MSCSDVSDVNRKLDQSEISVCVVLLRIVGSVVFKQKIANNKVDFIRTSGFYRSRNFRFTIS